MVWIWPAVKADDTSDIPESMNSAFLSVTLQASLISRSSSSSVFPQRCPQDLGQVGAGYLVIISLITEQFPDELPGNWVPVDSVASAGLETRPVLASLRSSP